MRLFSHILASLALTICVLVGAGQAFAAEPMTLQEQLTTAKELQDAITKMQSACVGNLSGRDLKYCDDLQSDLNSKLQAAQVDLNLNTTPSSLFGKDEKAAQTEVQKVSQKVRELANLIEQNRKVSVGILSVSGQTHFQSAKIFLDSVIDLLIKLIGIAALILLVFGGFRLIIAAGNDTEIQRAKDMIQYAVIGLIVALLSFIIVAVVQALLFR